MDHDTYDTVDRDWQTLAVPVVLILTGLLLMAGEALGVVPSLRLENLWPIAVLLIGLGELLPGLAGRPNERRNDGPR